MSTTRQGVPGVQQSVLRVRWIRWLVRLQCTGLLTSVAQQVALAIGKMQVACVASSTTLSDRAWRSKLILILLRRGCGGCKLAELRHALRSVAKLHAEPCPDPGRTFRVQNLSPDTLSLTLNQSAAARLDAVRTHEVLAIVSNGSCGCLAEMSGMEALACPGGTPCISDCEAACC